MKKYLVKYKNIWTDEIYIEGFALVTEEYKEFFDNLTENDFPLAHVIGWNQTIQYQELSELVKCYTWTLIGDLEYQVIKKFLGEDFGCFYFPDPEEDVREI